MSDRYIKEKACAAARLISERHGVDFQTALGITDAVLNEARSSILRLVGKQEWENMPFKDKAYVCQELVQSLLDREKMVGFLSGGRKTLV